MTLLDLGLPEISSGPEELLEEIIIDTLTLPTVTEAFAYNETGLPVKLELGFQKNIDALTFATREDSNEPFFRYQLVMISPLFKIDTLEDPFIIELQIDEQHILTNGEPLIGNSSVLSICSGIILLFVIFQFMSRGSEIAK